MKTTSNGSDILVLAESIADSLLVNAVGQVAERLRLVLPGDGDGGGWCRAAIVDRVRDHLETAAAGVRAAAAARAECAACGRTERLRRDGAEVLRPGTRVALVDSATEKAGERVQGVIDRVVLDEGGVLYRVSWWNGRTRCEGDFRRSALAPKGPEAGTVPIGFV